MKRFIWLFVVMFLAFAFPPNILLFLYFKVMGYNPESNLWLFLYAAIGFGLFGSFIVAPFIKFKESRVIRKFNNDKIAAKKRQNRSMTINLEYDSAFRKSSEILSLIGMRYIREKKTDGVIKGRTKCSLSLPSTKMEVRLRSIDDNHTEVIVRSRQIIPMMMMIDNGKNYENVETFCSEFRDLIVGGVKRF